ncbi:ATPase (AAA+ superfamily)-like protein [Halalkaliarchaeum desulfuricum]|uniref:ATPase (AAA+ superfamily)-like protein n=1 Tax=Halalkaliarchaeum desulfuricum TaxID=2055893 RepID=A0A343TGU3_9EURY|nr:DUF499 domain-containing protein [Halalkaliarchaeum desulfuricum]AUX08315.1 ATPase (AAA+ superfamily)-like protein [Halalkaliarchaeum desulfuricum]
MSEAGSLSKTLDDTVTLSRELREDGQIDGQVKLYNVDDENEFESDAELFFDRTLMTQGLREALSILRDSLTGDDPRGTHILYGPYGSGKSHQMVAMYHCFADPAAAGAWAGEEIEGFEDALPDSATPITVAMQNEQYEYLWEPFFEALDYDPGTYESGGYPDMQTIQDAVGDETVAFLVDELEDWFDTLQGDRKSANKAFLQSLLESTALSDLELYTIVSVLREDSEVHDILNREQAVEVNMNNQVDKRQVLLHRLIDNVDEAAAREIVNGYFDTYDQSDHVSIPDELLSEMHDHYPFHPVLLDALESRYYADEGNQNTRGMIYLFSKVLLEMRDRTDLITHGDIDAIEFEDELAKINYERLNAATGDIENRVDTDDVPHGRRILNTILLYSLKPSEGEGAEISEIVMGAYETGDLVSDVVLNLERLHGVAWHLHKLNGKYAIRDRQNPNALIRNAATDVSERSAKAEIADFVTAIFGSNAHPVGFRTDDIRDVPDDRDVKIVVKDDQWTQDEVKRVIRNDGRGREWRNTLVFVQPSGDKAIESGTRYIDKARYIEGARQVLADESLDEDIRESIRGMKEQEENELREELQLLYGEVLDGDNLLTDWDDMTPMDLDVYVIDGPELDADNIADSASADPLDLQSHVWPVADDLLDRRGEISIEDIYEQFLRDPELPIPGSANDVLNATVKALADKPVLARDTGGFRDDLSGSSLDTVLVRKDDVELWGVDDVEQELRRRFGSGTTAIDIGDFELELVEDGEVWIDGDSHDVVMRAIGRLNREDQYVIVKGNEILDKPQSDATLRDVGSARTVGASYLAARIEEAIDEDGYANLDTIIGEVRADESVFLPPDETETAARGAVNDFLVDDYVLEAGGRYLESLGDRDPTTVKIVPTVPDRIGEQILDYLDDLDAGDQFTVSKVADRFDDTVTEDMVQTFLLGNLGREEDPVYVVGPTGSEKASDWVPGYPFRIPDVGSETWRFEYNGDDVAAMRKKWRRDHQTGTVEYGDVTFMLPDREGVPGALQGTADIERTQVSLTLRSEQDYTKVQDLFERMPDEASSLKVEISFQK